MTIKELKQIIASLEKENNKKNDELLKFYKNLLNKTLTEIINIALNN